MCAIALLSLLTLSYFYTLIDFRSYVPPVQIGERMRGGAIARVLASKSPKAKEGDMVFSQSGSTEVAIVDSDKFDVIDLPKGTKVTDALGAAGRLISSTRSTWRDRI